ncbi:MAG: cell division protein FtsQ/DivIB [Pseudomonadales bacterium]
MGQYEGTDMNLSFSQVIRRYRLVLPVMGISVILLGVIWAFRESNSGVDHVSVAGDLDTRQRSQIFQQLAAMDGLPDIGHIKNRLEQIDWVYQVAVARDWPNGLMITVKEQEAIAYWNENAFINEKGDVFISANAGSRRLPQLYGPRDKERMVMRQYQQLSQVLSRTGQVLDTLRLDVRGSWAFTTRSGMEVLLGNENIMKRMQRYVRVFQQTGLVEEISRISRVDTRYSNGVAVDWKKSTDGFEVANAYKL